MSDIVSAKMSKVLDNALVASLDVSPVDEIQSLRQRVERLEGVLRDIVDRSHNDPLGTSKVIDMRKLAVAALSPKVQEGE